MTTLIHFAGPELTDLVEQIRNDQEGFEFECRRDFREKIVMPAAVESSMEDDWVDAFTRNISSNGICIIAPQPFRPTSQARVRLASESVPEPITCTCQWNKKFGLSYWISGWELNSKLPLGKLLKEDTNTEPPDISERLLRTAVPVSVQQDTSTRRVAAFTRTLSQHRVSLVSKTEFETNHPAVLQIRRLNGESSATVANCTWSRPYGSNHWISNWTFASADD
jgi:hypothetical protein